MEEADQVLARAKQDAAAYNFTLNPKKEVVNRIIKGLIKNKHENKEYFCPCKLEHIPENICM